MGTKYTSYVSGVASYSQFSVQDPSYLQSSNKDLTKHYEHYSKRSDKQNCWPYDTPPPATPRRGSLQLWQFLVALLDDPNNASCIVWTGRGMEFKLVEPEEVSVMCTNLYVIQMLYSTCPMAPHLTIILVNLTSLIPAMSATEILNISKVSYTRSVHIAAPGENYYKGPGGGGEYFCQHGHPGAGALLGQDSNESTSSTFQYLSFRSCVC
ncbi:hypothetical protein M8J76_012315 [Diaphorina citri]|nr:hypothetical protein M8J76_012315 [Diaphorina citri]